MGVPIHQARHEGSATAINHDGVLLTIRGHHRSDARNPAASRREPRVPPPIQHRRSRLCSW